MGKIVNHWGKWVDSDTPITGVLSTNDIAFEWLNDEICLTCEEIIQEIDNDDTIEDKQSEYDFIECNSDHTRLLGDWIKDSDGLYSPDKDNGEFSAIENETTIQVVWSKYLVRGPLCSPCYPGQADISSDSTIENEGFLAYTLPDYLLRKDED